MDTAQVVTAVTEKLAGPQKVWLFAIAGSDDRTYVPCIVDINLFHTEEAALKWAKGAVHDYYQDDDETAAALERLKLDDVIEVGDQYYHLWERDIHELG